MVNFKDVILDTARATLRPFKESDLADFYEYAKVEGVGEAAGWSHHKNIEESKKILDIFMKNNDNFAIEYKENHKLIGSIGVKYPSHNEFELEVGYVLSKDYWGKGIMTMVLKRLLKYLFLDLKIKSIEITYNNDNSKSARVAEKNGFKFYKFEDNITVVSLTREEYLKNTEIYQMYDKNTLERTNDIIYRGQTIPENLLASAVDVIIYNRKTNKYLLTKRDRNKDTFPGYWEFTGGMITHNEDIEKSLLREAYEETGLKVIDYKFLYKMIVENILFFTYIGYVEDDKITLQKGETENYKWVTLDEFKSIYETDDVPYTQKLRIKSFFEKFAS
jgi:ribosomal-protein-alanine N-acetyltransferase